MLALSGFRIPAPFPQQGVFEYVLGQPFELANEILPGKKVISRVEDDQAIFVDNQSNHTLTRGQLRQDAIRLAANLKALGLSPNDIVALPETPTCKRPEIAPVVLIQLPNCLAFATVTFGVWAAGLTASLASPALTSSELAWILQCARPKAIVTAKACLKAMREALEMQKDKTAFEGVKIFTVDVANGTYPKPSPSNSNSSSSETDWTSLLSSSSQFSTCISPSIPPSSASTRTAVILWSSGTSGRSKGVLLSHTALNFATTHLWLDADFFDHPPMDPTIPTPQRWLGFAPFYHVYGLVNLFLLSVASGATVYTMPHFSLGGMLEAVKSRKITYMHLAPPVAVMLAKADVVAPYAKRDPQTGQNAFSSVVAAVTGGAPLGHEVIVEVHKRLGFRIKMGYGLSETCSTSLQRGITKEEMDDCAGDSGLPHTGVEILIAAPERDWTPWPEHRTRAAKIGQEGEILVRAPCLMSAYLPPEALTAGRKAEVNMDVTMDALTPDGWFRTGDVGYLDKQGRVRITDRLKELIKVRAYQVAPAELEAILCSSEEIVDAGVVGIYDKSEATEWPRAFVVARDQNVVRDTKKTQALAGKIRELVEQRTANYKWLRGGLVFVDQIPKSPSGKILRRIIRDGKLKGVDIELYERRRRDAKL